MATSTQAKLVVLFVLAQFAFLLAVPYFAANAYTANDVALHLQHCLGKPVFLEPDLADRLSTDSLPPCEKEPLMSWGASRGMKIVWENDVLLISFGRSQEQLFGNWAWSRLELSLSVRSRKKNELPQIDDRPDEYKFIPMPQEVADEELGKLKGWVLRSIPMPPVSYPKYCETCVHDKGVRVARIALQMEFEKVKLGANEPDRIVGWVGADRFCRVIVGQLDDKGFHLAWLSPLTGCVHDAAVPGPGILYRDVNADGIAEIWVYLHLEYGSQWGQYLSIFDVNGKELTRDAGECGALEGTPPGRRLPLPVVCPIAGVPVINHYFEDDENRKVELEAAWDLQGSEEDARIYKLIGGKYVRIESASPQEPAGPIKKKIAAMSRASGLTMATTLNEEGQVLMRGKQYETAAHKFAQAAETNPDRTASTALYANNAGFAYYKIEKYEESVIWFKKALAVDPKRAVAYLNLGDAYAKLNRNPEARQAYAMYLELAPDSKSAPDVKKKLAALPSTP